jgi:hypothetical protein
MKTDRHNLRSLLDEVLPAIGQPCGPSRAELVALVRSEHTRRQRVRTALTTTAVCLLAALIFTWPPRTPTVAPVADALKMPPPIVIQEVDDQQLFALLKDMPTALVEGPNGERTLMVVER